MTGEPVEGQPFIQTSLEQVLANLCQAGGFAGAILVSGDGLPIAAVGNEIEADTIAAMVALVRSVVERTQIQVRLAHIEEVSILDRHRQQLVCRYFTVGENPLILAVVVPAKIAYRKATRAAIRQIRALWPAAHSNLLAH